MVDFLEFLSYRLAFCGLPFAEVQDVLRTARNGGDWGRACRSVATKCEELARQAESAKRTTSAAQAWRWAASAYHAATFAFHFDGGAMNPEDVLELRRAAREMYLRSIPADHLVETVRVECGGLNVAGYWRTPKTTARGAVALFNGLDSISEVELHSFSDWLLARGLATLALDLPACMSNEPRRPCFEVEQLAPHISEWVASRTSGANTGVAAFGVSFGGHLVARALSNGGRFVCGLAVSPCAWVDTTQLASHRFRMMLAFGLGWPVSNGGNKSDSSVQLEGLPRPKSPLMVYHMDHDAVFGREHMESIVRWGGERVQVKNWEAEHVGTSRIHEWLPEACDWLAAQFK